MRKKKNVKKKIARSDTSSKSRKTIKIKAKKTATRVARTRNGGKWTEAQYFQKIRSCLRNGFKYWVPMMQALEKAKRIYSGPNKRQKFEYQCAKCKKWYLRTSVEIDHVIPCGSLNKYEDIVPFIINLTPESVDSYQILCKTCHKAKTEKEKEERKSKK